MGESFFDNDKAVTRCNRLWRRLGSVYETQALDLAKKGLLESSLRAARYADVCFWQATGEFEPLSMQSVMFPDPKQNQ